MVGEILLDTNIWIYFYSVQPADKHEKARRLVEDRFEEIILTSQVLGELYHVLTRKNLKSAEEAGEIVEELVESFPVLGIGTPQVLKAIEIRGRYGFSYWDSLLLATGVLHGVTTLYSEDLQDSQVLEGALRVVNPLVAR